MTQGRHSRRVLEARALGSAFALTLAAFLPLDTARATSFCAAADSVEPMRLVLNVPAARLDVLAAERLTRSYRVAVGTPDHPTPIGASPSIGSSGTPGGCLPRSTGPGKCGSLPRGPTTRPAGSSCSSDPTSSSTLEESIGQAASHGCVRLTYADAIALARAAHAYGSPDLDPAVLDSLVADPDRTRTIRLTRPISLSIVYDRIEVREGRLVLHPDPYGRAPIECRDLVSQLAAVGLPPGGVEPAVLDVALERAERETVTLSIRDLPSLD